MFIPFLLTWVKYLKKATQGKNVYFGSVWGHSHGVDSLRREPWKADEQQHGEMKAHSQLWFLFLLVLYFRLDPEWTLNGPLVGWVFILQCTQSRKCQAWSQASSLSDARLCPVEINSNHHDWRYELLLTIMGMNLVPDHREVLSVLVWFGFTSLPVSWLLLYGPSENIWWLKRGEQHLCEAMSHPHT